MARALLGILKGLLIGGGAGFALLRLGLSHPVFSYLACALACALTGLVCGRPPWRAETIWTPVMKVVFGVLLGVGLFALGRRFIPAGAGLTIQGLPEIKLASGVFLAPAIGVLYGLFVEVDDGGGERTPPARKPKKELPPTS